MDHETAEEASVRGWVAFLLVVLLIAIIAATAVQLTQAGAL